MKIDGLNVILEQEINTVKIDLGFPYIYVPNLDFEQIISKFNMPILKAMGKSYSDVTCNKKV